MKKFTGTICIFATLLIVFICFVNYGTSVIIQKKANFKIGSDNQYLLLGHSHPECAFNDSLIDGLFNAAESGEAYFYTYHKAKNLLAQNPSIKTVFIEFANNQITESMNEWIWDGMFVEKQYPVLSPYMNFEENKMLARNNFKSYFNSFFFASKDRIGRVFSNDYDYRDLLGGYLYLERDKTDSLLTVDTIPYNFLDYKLIDKKISTLNLEYLKKTIDLCKQYNKKVYLIRSPLHPNYTGYYNEHWYQAIRKKEFKDIEYLDFANYPLKSTEFGDLEHLNHKGARIFSEWFNLLIKSNLLDQGNKQEMIDKEILKLKNLEKRQVNPAI